MVEVREEEQDMIDCIVSTISELPPSEREKVTSRFLKDVVSLVVSRRVENGFPAARGDLVVDAVLQRRRECVEAEVAV